ncbi:Cyclin, C-terminal domain [Musa troglodytarum]|uniref:Cyclin, C-terminal domain n=1 Tax=Musa troglodytarum TaxID=320322 RepID=A0A9E7ECH1_9LILI|nr:Cyclin, C-terminal domain [Musa troglodytarum]
MPRPAFPHAGKRSLHPRPWPPPRTSSPPPTFSAPRTPATWPQATRAATTPSLPASGPRPAPGPPPPSSMTVALHPYSPRRRTTCPAPTTSPASSPAPSTPPPATTPSNGSLKHVNELYRFRPLTAYLSVNYLDRFLSSHSLPGLENGGSGGGWPMQLLSVACVSVAAKMEETHVPSLLDLQFLDQRYVFDPHTVGRMELLLMTALGWRMRAITPFDFLPHLVPSCPSALLSRAADLILSSLRVVDFLGYRPSAIAAAAALCTADEVADPSAGGSADVLRCSDEWVNKVIPFSFLSLDCLITVTPC